MGVATHPRARGPRAVFEPTGSQRDAASTIFNLSDYRVINALDQPIRTLRGRPGPPGHHRLGRGVRVEHVGLASSATVEPVGPVDLDDRVTGRGPVSYTHLRAHET